MATSGNAVFTEVLQIGIDTTQFAAQMKQVEQIYANSLKNMPDLGSVGNVEIGSQLKRQAEIFTLAAEQIGKASHSITEDVAIMVQQSNANMEAMASKAKSSVSKTSEVMSEGVGVSTRFGNALERAFIRVPAMAIASGALLLAVTALGAPLKALSDGFENLGNQTPEFKQVRTQLADMLSLFESIAAKPVFDFILKQLQSLSVWLKENKVYVDQLATGLGMMATAFLSSVVDFAKLDLVKEGFKGIAEIVIYTTGALTGLINKFTTLIALGNNALNNENQHGSGYNWTHMLSNLTTGSDKILATYNKNEDQNATAMVQALNALNGEGTATVDKNIKPASQLQTSQEIMAQFRTDLSEIKDKGKQAADTIQQQVAAQTLSKVAALPKILAADKEERDSVQELIAKYRELLKSATDLNSLDNSKFRTESDRLLLGGRGTNSPYTASETRDNTAQKAANAERVANAKAVALAELKLHEDAYKAEVSLIKKAVQEGHATRVAGVEADIQLEKIRHEAALAEIASRPGADGTLAATERQNALNAENQKHQITGVEQQHALTEAHRQDALALDKYNDSLAKSNIALKEAQLTEATTLGQKQRAIALNREVIQLKLQEAQLNLQLAREEQLKFAAGSPGSQTADEKIRQLQAEIVRLKNLQHNASESGTALGHFEAGDTQSVGDQLKESLHLDQVAQDFANAKDKVQVFAAGLEGATNILSGLANAVSNAAAAYAKGGAVGAAGSLLSNSSVTSGIGDLVGKVSESAGKLVPIIGPMIGTMFSTITQLFSMGIQKMVDDINNKISKINEQAQLGQITLQQQIQELQQEKQDAINQLGGSKKKGASAELDKILKSLNQEIAQLQKQQHDIITNFNQMVAAMSLGTTVMSQWYQTWTQINQQVKQYVDAGGSLATAAQFLNMQLQQQRQQLQDQLNQGDQTAIQDAIQLNDLTRQRLQMLQTEAQTEFGIINANSIERRESSAVVAGAQLALARSQFSVQLESINNQISLTQQKVTLESKIFDINKSLADLQAASNALTLHSLNEQLAKYQDMQTLLKATAGLIFTPANIPTSATATLGIPGEPTVAGPVIGTVNIGVNGPVTAANAQTLASEIAYKLRSGQTTFSVGSA